MYNKILTDVFFSTFKDLTWIFVTAINRGNAEVLYLNQSIPKISDAHIKEGIFVAPRIR